MARSKTIYYLPKYGQLGNQLAALAHLLAFAVEYDYQIVHFASQPLLTNLNKTKLGQCRVRFSKWLANPLFSFGINKLVKLVSFNRNMIAGNTLFANKEYVADKDFDDKHLPQRIVITNWLFRFYSGVIKHQDVIRKCIAFDEPLYGNAKQLWQSATHKFPMHTWIGVHVRRGDYASFLDGKYFYDNKVYYAKMKSIAEQLDKSAFIVCSNEELHFEDNGKLNIVYANGSPAEDIFLLSQCKYIIGPPSTFSSWAAFAGDQNLLFLEDKNQNVSLQQFEKYYL